MSEELKGMRKTILLRLSVLISVCFLLINYANLSFSMYGGLSGQQLKINLFKINSQNYREVSTFIHQGFREYDTAKKGFAGNVGFPSLYGNRNPVQLEGANWWGGISIGYMRVYLQIQKKAQACVLSYIFDYKRKYKCSFVRLGTFCEAQKNFFESIGFEVEFARKGYDQDKTYYYLRCDNDRYKDPRQPFVGVLKSEAGDPKAYKIGYILKEGPLLVGAIEARVCLGCLHILNICIKKEYRKRGFGKKLIEKVLEDGKRYRCRFAILETFDYMAPGFYKKLGFKVDFMRKGYWANVEQYCMSKKIS